MHSKNRPEGFAVTAAMAAFTLFANVPSLHAQAPAIETSALKPLSAWEVGAPEPGALAFPAALWAGSDGASLADVFAQLPNAFSSPAARRLAFSVLLSPSAASEAASFKALLERYEAIGRLGAATALTDMVRLSAQARSEPNLAVFAAQAELALQRPSEACRRTRDAPPSLPTLLKLRAYCLAITGDGAGTNVAIDVARSAGAADKLLYAALPLLAGGTGGAAPARYDNSLNAAVSLAAKLRTPAQPLMGASNLALLTISGSMRAPAPLRAEALYAVLTRGILEPSSARAAAQESLKAWPSGRGAPAIPTWLRALRDVDTASGAQRPGKVADALARAPNAMERLALARLFMAELTGAPGQGPAPPNALRLARSALVLGETQAARRWRAVLGSETSAASLATLDAALAVADGGDSIEAARQRLGANAGDVNRALRDVALLGMLSPLPPDLQGLSAQSGTDAAARADDAAWLALGAAADRGAMGETALRAAILAKDGPAALDRAKLARLVEALKKVGLANAARALIAEAILG